MAARRIQQRRSPSSIGCICDAASVPTEQVHDPAQQFVGLTDGEWKAARDPRFAMISLDPDTADWVRGYLEGYREATGATILLASHNMSEVERMGSEVLMMKEGHIVDRGRPRDIILRHGRQTLEEVFLDIARSNRHTDTTGL